MVRVLPSLPLRVCRQMWEAAKITLLNHIQDDDWPNDKVRSALTVFDEQLGQFPVLKQLNDDEYGDYEDDFPLLPGESPCSSEDGSPLGPLDLSGSDSASGDAPGGWPSDSGGEDEGEAEGGSGWASDNDHGPECTDTGSACAASSHSWYFERYGANDGWGDVVDADCGGEDRCLGKGLYERHGRWADLLECLEDEEDKADVQAWLEEEEEEAAEGAEGQGAALSWLVRPLEAVVGAVRSLGRRLKAAWCAAIDGAGTGGAWAPSRFAPL